MQEQLVVSNHSPRRVEFDLALEIGNDFADIFAVKAYDFALGDPDHAKPLPAPSPPVYEAEDNQFVFSVSDNGFHGLTQVVLSERGEAEGSKVTYRIELEPRETWRLRADVIPGDRRAYAPPCNSPSGASATSSRASAPRWRPGASASRSSAAPGTTSRTRSASRSPISPRFGWTRTPASRVSCRRPGCRGS